MSSKEVLQISNLNEGEVLDDLNQAILEVQDALIAAKGGKATISLKLSFDQQSDSIIGVTAELSKSTPKTKRKGLYAKGARYLEADTVYKPQGKQQSIGEVDKVVDLNRKVQ